MTATIAAGATIARSASAEKRADGDNTLALASFREQPPDHRVGRVVLALTDVPIADDALAIDQDRRRPGPDAPPLPDRLIVVLHDRVPDTERLGGAHDLVVRLLPEEFGRVHA